MKIDKSEIEKNYLISISRKSDPADGKNKRISMSDLKSVLGASDASVTLTDQQILEITRNLENSIGGKQLSMSSYNTVNMNSIYYDKNDVFLSSTAGNLSVGSTLIFNTGNHSISAKNAVVSGILVVFGGQTGMEFYMAGAGPLPNVFGKLVQIDNSEIFLKLEPGLSIKKPTLSSQLDSYKRGLLSTCTIGEANNSGSTTYIIQASGAGRSGWWRGEEKLPFHDAPHGRLYPDSHNAAYNYGHTLTKKGVIITDISSINLAWWSSQGLADNEIVYCAVLDNGVYYTSELSKRASAIDFKIPTITQFDFRFDPAKKGIIDENGVFEFVFKSPNSFIRGRSITFRNILAEDVTPITKQGSKDLVDPLFFKHRPTNPIVSGAADGKYTASQQNFLGESAGGYFSPANDQNDFQELVLEKTEGERTLFAYANKNQVERASVTINSLLKYTKENRGLLESGAGIRLVDGSNILAEYICGVGGSALEYVIDKMDNVVTESDFVNFVLPRLNSKIKDAYAVVVDIKDVFDPKWKSINKVTQSGAYNVNGDIVPGVQVVNMGKPAEFYMDGNTLKIRSNKGAVNGGWVIWSLYNGADVTFKNDSQKTLFPNYTGAPIPFDFIFTEKPKDAQAFFYVQSITPKTSATNEITVENNYIAYSGPSGDQILDLSKLFSIIEQDEYTVTDTLDSSYSLGKKIDNSTTKWNGFYFELMGVDGNYLNFKLIIKKSPNITPIYAGSKKTIPINASGDYEISFIGSEVTNVKMTLNKNIQNAYNLIISRE